MNVVERKKMVACMEYIARHINDESIFMGWLMGGVADGDIQYGYLNPDGVDEGYVDDDRYFAELMECFLRKMVAADKSGGLYCDGVVTGSSDVEND